MSITEYERHQLFIWFEEHMGKERATTMMNLVPPVGWGDVATARDLELQGAKVREEIATVRHDIAAMEARFSRTFAGWLFASQAAVIGAIGVLLAID